MSNVKCKIKRSTFRPGEFLNTLLETVHLVMIKKSEQEAVATGKTEPATRPLRQVVLIYGTISS